MEFSKLILFCYVFCRRKVHRSHVGYLQTHAFLCNVIVFFNHYFLLLLSGAQGPSEGSPPGSVRC
jgi:hypothetical protein